MGYHSAGFHADTFTVSNSCDSIRILNLTVTPLIRRKTNKSICKGERYFAGGISQTISGLYYDTILSNTGCDTIVETTLIVSSLPRPDLGPDKEICTGDSVLINAGNYSTYLWSNGTTLPTLQIKGPGTFGVSVTDSYGCKGFDNINAKQINCKAIQIPNAFSPNGDGIYDIWAIPRLQNILNCRVQIFDRYGRIVFSSTGYKNVWDGKLNGTPLPIATYYYIITAGSVNYRNSVTIIR